MMAPDVAPHLRVCACLSVRPSPRCRIHVETRLLRSRAMAAPKKICCRSRRPACGILRCPFGLLCPAQHQPAQCEGVARRSIHNAANHVSVRRGDVCSRRLSGSTTALKCDAPSGRAHATGRRTQPVVARHWTRRKRPGGRPGRSRLRRRMETGDWSRETGGKGAAVWARAPAKSESGADGATIYRSASPPTTRCPLLLSRASSAGPAGRTEAPPPPSGH